MDSEVHLVFLEAIYLAFWPEFTQNMKTLMLIICEYKNFLTYIPAQNCSQNYTSVVSHFSPLDFSFKIRRKGK